MWIQTFKERVIISLYLNKKWKLLRNSFEIAKKCHDKLMQIIEKYFKCKQVKYIKQRERNKNMNDMKESVCKKRKKSNFKYLKNS